MKEFNEKNFKAFIATQDMVKDEIYDSGQGIAQDVLERFNRWRAEDDSSKVLLPVRVRDRCVVDRNGKTIAQCPTVKLAQSMRDELNRNYKVDDDEDDEDDDYVPVTRRPKKCKCTRPCKCKR